MASVPEATSSSSSLLDGNAGAALADDSESVDTLTAAIATAFISFGIQLLAFLILRWRLTRIYRPRTYMVAERQRVPLPPPGPWQWLIPLFRMPNSVVINKCGLDAYFFLRYLRMLLKIFIPLSVVILPILVPINYYSGNNDGTITGLNKLGWQNVDDAHVQRLWAHLTLAVLVIIWVLYVVFQELRGYIRIRQAYLTSPQHRIRASATTVLVSGIPRKWLSVEALDGLYDVFPGGIRNIWINRDYSDLLVKVKQRDKIAKNLESAETSLIKSCIQKHKDAEEKAAKQSGVKRTKEEQKTIQAEENEKADRTAQGKGMSSGDPHQIPRDARHVGVDGGSSDTDSTHENNDADDGSDKQGLYLSNPLRFVGHGLGAVTHGLAAVGNRGKQVVGGVAGGLEAGVLNVNSAINSANAGRGFALDDSASELSVTPQTSQEQHELAFIRPTARPLPSAPHAGQNDQSLTTRPGVRAVHDDHDALAAQQHASRLVAPRVTIEPPSTGPTQTHFDGAHVSDEEHDNYGPEESQEPQGGFKGIIRTTTDKIKAHKQSAAIAFPSPQPHGAEGDEYPLDLKNAPVNSVQDPNKRVAKSKWAEALAKAQFWRSSEDKVVVEYPKAFHEEYAEDQDGQPEWKKYIDAKDRPMLRLPLAGWMPKLPYIGKQVDKIYFLRKELARLNAEVEEDQGNIERFPFMNSAFIQFNHQIAAHMACQSVSHHIPHYMAPRHVEIAPQDVIWGNMSIKWWERYIRTGIVLGIVFAMVVLFAIPITFTGLLSQVSVLATDYSWLAWLDELPAVVISIIQGTLPPVLLSVLLLLVPVIFRVLVKLQGVPTGSDKELGVQEFYFFFLFVQVFLVVTLSTGLTDVLTTIAKEPTSIVTTLAENIPKATNYFFSFMIVQALSNSSSALVQIVTLLKWFVLAPISDSTARQKWRRQTRLSNVQWGSYFPPFTNFAVIGLVFCIISPLILLFNLVTFSLFWVVQRYNIIYVHQFMSDTGGLLFPVAVNQLFAGIYVMEICLIGLFFIAENTAGNLAAIPQAIIMIVMIVATVGFQVLMNQAIRPLLRYLPITLEDDAVIRDEEFARANAAKFRGLAQEEGHERPSEDIEDRLEHREKAEEEADRAAEEADLERAREYRARTPSRSASRHADRHLSDTQSKTVSSWKDSAKRTAYTAPTGIVKRMTFPVRRPKRNPDPSTQTTNGYSVQTNDRNDPENQRLAGDVLFSGFSDELEDLTPQERDTLVRYSFQHEALRARRPVVWIPRDKLGVSDDEIARSRLMSTVDGWDEEGRRSDDNSEGSGTMGEEARAKETKTYIWMSNEGTALDAKGRVVFRRSPPDFASVDLIAL